jgi:hypothetical protein
VLFMRLGLQAAALVCVVASALSWAVGYPPDLALLRGVVAAVAVGIVGYVAELVVATTPGGPGGARGERVPHGQTPVSPVPVALEGEITAPDQHGKAA